MKKDFNELRDRAERQKKPLTEYQMKQLIAIFDEKINQRIEAENKNNNTEREKLEAKLCEQATKKEEVKKAMATILSAEKEIEKAEKVLENNFLKFETTYSSGDIRILSTVSHPFRPEIEKLSEQTQSRLLKMNELRNKLKMNILFMPIEYNDIDEYIDNEIAKL